MRRIALAVSLAAAALAAPPRLACAQSDATLPPARADAAINPIPEPQAPATASPTPPATAGKQPSTTAPNVVVTARPLHACKPGDQTCIDQVIELIWRRYPKQIEAMCAADGWQRISQGFSMQDLGIGANTVTDHPPPATHALCEYGAKLKKR